MKNFASRAKSSSSLRQTTPARGMLAIMAGALVAALPATARARRAEVVRFLWHLGVGLGCNRQQSAGQRQIGFAAGTCEQAVVADAVEPARQDMEQEAADELVGAERHGALPFAIIAAIVFVAEGDAGLVEADQATVRDGDPVRVAREVSEHGLGPGKGRLGIDDPAHLPDRREVAQEGTAVVEMRFAAMEAEPAGVKEREQPGKEGPAALGTDHFLAGILWDDLGRHMLLDVNWVDGRPYHFYVSSNAQWSQAEYRRAYRSRADRLDSVASAALGAFLADRSRLRAALGTHGLFGDDLDRLIARGDVAADRLANTPTDQLEALFAALFMRIEVSPDELTMHVRLIELRRFLEWEGQGNFVGRPADWPTSNSRYAIEVPVTVIASERWPAFPAQPRDPAEARKPDKQLSLLLRSARAAQALFETHRELDLAGLARRFGRSPGYFSRLIRLNYLAPDIVAAIADGTQPYGLDRKTLASAHIPLDWAVQRRMFGFPEPRRHATPRNLFGRGMWPSR